MEVETDGKIRELAIQIEHQSAKEDISERMFEYLCYVWLLKKKPVWSMVIYTDDAVWKKKVPDQFCYAFSRENHEQVFRFDVIKIKAEKSSDMIRKHSLLCKLLALKADDTGTDPESLLHEIYRAVAQMKNGLDHDRLLLIHQWTDFYKKVPDETIGKIRKDVGMELIETTISEHVFNQGVNQGNTIMLSRMMAKKYHVSPEQLSVQLEPLNNDELLELGDRILEWDSFEKVQQWIEDRKKS